MLAGIEVLDSIELGRDQQGSVQPISPPVVSTAKQFSIPATCGGSARAMSAHVIEGAEDAILAAGDEQRLSDQVKSEVIAGLRDLMNVPYKLPCTRKDPA